MPTRRRRSAALAVVGCALLPPSLGAAQPNDPTPPKVERATDFDFLLGTWDLAIESTLPGIPPKLRGRWTFEALADGLVVADEYRVFDDKGATAYLGTTYRAFDPARHEWAIRYLEPRTGRWYEAKGWREGAIRFVQQRGTEHSPEALLRFRYFDITDDHFRWSSERSDDGGKSWKAYGLNISAARAVAVVAASPSAAGHDSAAMWSRLVAAKSSLMSADYRADLASLARLRDEVTAWRDDASLGYLADYWSGYAGWRLAMNAGNAGMNRVDLESHLRRAAADFEASLQAKDDFADAYAAAASVHGWLLTLHLDEPELRRLHAERSGRWMARAKELDPSNPRVLWVEGGNLLFRPKEYGGDFERGMATYRTIVATAAPLAPRSPLPDWGKVEAIMSLAYGHLNQPAPDFEAARTEAEEALRLEPDWHYVRKVLLPRIEEGRAQMTSTKERPE